MSDNPFKHGKVRKSHGSAGWGGLIDGGRQWAVILPGDGVVADGFRKEAEAKAFLAGLEMGWDWGARKDGT